MQAFTPRNLDILSFHLSTSLAFGLFQDASLPAERREAGLAAKRLQLGEVLLVAARQQMHGLLHNIVGRQIELHLERRLRAPLGKVLPTVAPAVRTALL